MTTKVNMLVPFLLPGLFFFSSLAHDAGLHPVVLLPGYSCSQLDARLTDEYQPPPGCGARKGGGWFRLWENYTAVKQNPALVPCYADQLRLVYEPVAGDYRDVPGVQTRVVDFGTTRGFGFDDPAKKNNCMERLVNALEAVGYKEGENLFGAPYDFRYAAAAPGKASAVFSRFLTQLKLLVEHASNTNGNKPVILLTHSLGGLNALAFLNTTTLPWRRRYIKHFVMVSTGAGGAVALLQTSGSPPSPGDILSFANTSRSFATTFSVMPSPRVFGHAPLVVTRARNYSAYDIPELLAADGFSDDEVARYVTRALPVTMNLKAPAVPVTCINGVGVPTVEKLVYRDGDLGSAPQLVLGDGDGVINLVSILALDTVIGADPEQDYFKSVLIHNASHLGIIAEDFAVRRVVNEIIHENRRSNVDAHSLVRTSISSTMGKHERATLPWRRRHAKHFVMISTGAGGIVASLQTSGSSSLSSQGTDVLSFANTSRSFATVFLVLPSPRFFCHVPLVVTRARNYSAYDIPELLAADGFSDDEVARYVTRELPVAMNLKAPGVSVICINGVGVPTVERLVYSDGDFGAAPQVEYGDGHGGINLASILALDTIIGV
ncbi:hypothetical protein EJB05_22980, partial [Eragrostis curvula]